MPLETFSNTQAVRVAHFKRITPIQVRTAGAGVIRIGHSRRELEQGRGGLAGGLPVQQVDGTVQFFWKGDLVGIVDNVNSQSAVIEYDPLDTL